MNDVPQSGRDVSGGSSVKQAPGKRRGRRIAIGLAIIMALLSVAAVMPTSPRPGILREMQESMAKHKRSIRKDSHVILVDYDLLFPAENSTV